MSTRLPGILWGVACTVIVLAIIAGLFLTGGPQAQRQKRMDERRVRDLITVRDGIARYYRGHERLPDSLAPVAAGDSRVRESLRDPETDQPYTYRKLSADSFELCATFRAETTDGHLGRVAYEYAETIHRHGKGHQCFISRRVEDGVERGPHDGFQWVQ